MIAINFSRNIYFCAILISLFGCVHKNHGNQSPADEVRRTIVRIESIPGDQPPLKSEVEKAMIGFMPIRARGLKMGYSYVGEKGYRININTHNISFAVSNRLVDNIIAQNGLEQIDLTSTTKIGIRIKSISVLDPRGYIIYSKCFGGGHMKKHY